MKDNGKSFSRFMMYFNSDNLREIRHVSRCLGIAMVDLVDAALDGYIYKKGEVPMRKQKRYVGPRDGTQRSGELRVRYVMRLPKGTIDRARNIASAENRRFTHVCDEAISEFVRFTKQARHIPRQVKTSHGHTEAVRGRKSTLAVQEIQELLAEYKGRMLTT
jgi:hypothetical protein